MSKPITAGLFVSADGTWGDASGMTIIDDRDWTTNDYELLDEVSDGSRADLADAIDLWIKDNRPQLEDFEEDNESLVEFILDTYTKRGV